MLKIIPISGFIGLLGMYAIRVSGGENSTHIGIKAHEGNEARFSF